jgi:hypothetical protein
MKVRIAENIFSSLKKKDKELGGHKIKVTRLAPSD